MALEDILKRIREDAHKEAEKVRKEAKARAEAILEESKNEASSIRESLIKEGKASSLKERRRILTLSNLESRKEILKKKQSFIEEAFQMALQHLENLSNGQYCSTIKKMLLQTVESGEEEVIISPRDEKRMTPSFLEEVNEGLAENGKSGKLRLSPERREFSGGFILRSGRKEIKCTFTSIFKVKREELEGEVASILFRGNRSG